MESKEPEDRRAHHESEALVVTSVEVIGSCHESGEHFRSLGEGVRRDLDPQVHRVGEEGVQLVDLCNVFVNALALGEHAGEVREKAGKVVHCS